MSNPFISPLMRTPLTAPPHKRVDAVLSEAPIRRRKANKLDALILQRYPSCVSLHKPPYCQLTSTLSKIVCASPFLIRWSCFPMRISDAVQRKHNPFWHDPGFPQFLHGLPMSISIVMVLVIILSLWLLRPYEFFTADITVCEFLNLLRHIRRTPPWAVSC